MILNVLKKISYADKTKNNGGGPSNIYEFETIVKLFFFLSLFKE